MNATAVRNAIRNTRTVHLVNGKQALVSELGAGEWLVSIEGEHPTGFRHDTRTGRSACECGAPLTCDHREAVCLVAERR